MDKKKSSKTRKKKNNSNKQKKKDKQTLDQLENQHEKGFACDPIRAASVNGTDPSLELLCQADLPTCSPQSTSSITRSHDDSQCFCCSTEDNCRLLDNSRLMNGASSTKEPKSSGLGKKNFQVSKQETLTNCLENHQNKDENHQNKEENYQNKGKPDRDYPDMRPVATPEKEDYSSKNLQSFSTSQKEDNLPLRAANGTTDSTCKQLNSNTRLCMYVGAHDSGRSSEKTVAQDCVDGVPFAQAPSLIPKMPRVFQHRQKYCPPSVDSGLYSRPIRHAMRRIPLPTASSTSETMMSLSSSPCSSIGVRLPTIMIDIIADRKTNNYTVLEKNGYLKRFQNNRIVQLSNRLFQNPYKLCGLPDRTFLVTDFPYLAKGYPGTDRRAYLCMIGGPRLRLLQRYLLPSSMLDPCAIATSPTTGHIFFYARGGNDDIMYKFCAKDGSYQAKCGVLRQGPVADMTCSEDACFVASAVWGPPHHIRVYNFEAATTLATFTTVGQPVNGLAIDSLGQLIAIGLTKLHVYNIKTRNLAKYVDIQNFQKCDECTKINKINDASNEAEKQEAHIELLSVDVIEQNVLVVIQNDGKIKQLKYTN